jgi:outer membrane protein TolC
MKSDKLKEKMLGNSPDLKSLNESVTLNEKVMSLKKKTTTPTLSLFGGWNYVGSSQEAAIGGRDSFQAVSSIGLSLKIPFDIGGSSRAQYEQAVQDHYQTKLQLSKTQKNFNLEIDNALDECQGLLVIYKANLEAVRLAQSSLQLSRSMFESGKLTLTDLNNAELLLSSQKLGQESSVFRINNLLAKIEKLTAKDLGSY